MRWPHGAARVLPGPGWNIQTFHGKNRRGASTTLRSDTKAGFYPLFVDVSGKLCVVVGGGRVAERKARTLARLGASVRVISPRLTRGLQDLGCKGRLEILPRGYADGDLKGAFIIFAATDNRRVNTLVRAEAVREGILVNVADDPSLCDFIAPSLVRKGPITVAISTSGTLPLLAKKLRKEIQQLITTDHIAYARKAGALRKTVIVKVRDRARKTAIMRRLASMDVKEVASMSREQLLKVIMGGLQ
jgi:precorrin-2 dehydrogenase / sirohydrochlorin ferrochelatase